ncbi:cell division ATP-binding protein FtsE [Candidatus Jorgensenbacteria bacterium RIFCSPLOWO2_01_FULL_45_25b]|uniref:Cell division ATP-binding protein FtsE n=1 Tax=Candidatus Jorgensenbacteria bacterium RIFCSPLOWO2_01_FULL_45_25b TaxID=1798471 RepID=A0A1F6BXX6_9BACT|nr:MAG: cell division ATP-binding protein FtsE [Candidatus Jorgensenbacteria bacterium RIFCSPLOWO2_01_FULL_45_25b]
MIYFNKVSKVYPDNSVALDNVTFSIAPKEFVSIVGHSGAGKTTLLRMMLLEERPSTGEVSFESINLNDLRGEHIPQFRRRIGVIFQDFRLLSTKTAFENVAFAMEAAGVPDDIIQTDVPEVLELVGLEKKIWSFPHQLSGGEKQRVAIARAIINQPEIIIADEPTGNLDPVNTYEIIQILKKINDLGTTVVMTTHNKGIIDTLGKRVITLETGRLIRDDKEGKYIL